MLLQEERRSDLVYEETKNKVIVQLEGSESASLTKLVNMYKDWDATYQAYKQLREQVSVLSNQARDKKEKYEQELRDTNNKYFDVVADSSKTKVIRSMRYAIKISKDMEGHENRDTDWESVVNELAEVMQIPLDVLNKAIEKYTQVEMVIPKAKLYKPEDLTIDNTTNESFGSNWITSLLSKIRKYYEKLLNKFYIYDTIMDKIAEKYSL